MSLTPWTFDAESYYTDKANGEYSLTWMTAEEYIRDPRFELIGFSMKPGNGETRWFTGDLPYLRSVAQQFDWSKILVIGHNMSEFDSLILSHVLGVRPAAYACTLQMARSIHGSKGADGKNFSNSLDKLAAFYGLPAKGQEVKYAINKRRADFTPWQLDQYGNYCNLDTDLCWQLFNIFVQKMPAASMWMASLCTKMFAQPRLMLDLPLLREMKIDMAQAKEELLVRVADILSVDPALPHEDRMLATKQLLGKDAVLANVFKNQYDIDPPMKPSPKRRNADGSPVMVYAFAKTDEGMEALLDFEDESDPDGAEDIQALAAARLGVKSTLAESRVGRFIGIAERGLLPVPLAYGKTHTDRLAGCLVAGTKIICYDSYSGVVTKRIVDVLATDLVWDGEEFVEHAGVKFQGMAEVIEHDGITGTVCHPVFTEEGSDATVSLATAKGTGARIVACREPSDWEVENIERAHRLSRSFVPLSVRLR